jgi:hypothetical protein
MVGVVEWLSEGETVRVHEDIGSVQAVSCVGLPSLPSLLLLLVSFSSVC